MSRSYLIHGSRCRLHLCCHLYVRKNALPFRQPFNIRASILAYGPCETVTSHKERRVFLFGGINRGLSHVDEFGVDESTLREHFKKDGAPPKLVREMAWQLFDAL